MKKTYHIIMTIIGIVWMALSTTLLSSCLDENPKDRLLEYKAYDTATNLYINSVGNLYNYIGGNSNSQGIQGTYRGVYDYNTFTTDEAILPTRGGDWYDGGFWQNLYWHQWTATDKALLDTWNYLYKVVGLCNHSLAEIEYNKNLLTDAEYNEYTAEVKGMRAMFYFYIMDMFGNVPLSMKDGATLTDITQSPRNEVAQTIISQLQEAAKYLPDEHSNLQGKYYGKFTRPVAYFILAKMMLNNEIYLGTGEHIFSIGGKELNAWEACIYYCDMITKEGYSLEKNYADNFAVHNENSSENIFTIPMDKTLYSNQFWNLFRSRHYNHGSAIGMDAENGSCATISTIKTYGYGTDSLDNRYKINFYSDTLRVDGNIVYLNNGDPLIYRPLEVAPDLTGSKYEKTGGARMAKYEIDRTAHADGKLQDNDIVLFRYSDVLLMIAEAKVRNGEDGTDELNMIRNRVGMNNRKATLNNILAERLLEFMWEGWRRNDMIRFGVFQKAYDQRKQVDNEDSKFTYLFPIPQAVIDLNNKLKQNIGYK